MLTSCYFTLLGLRRWPPWRLSESPVVLSSPILMLGQLPVKIWNFNLKIFWFCLILFYEEKVQKYKNQQRLLLQIWCVPTRHYPLKLDPDLFKKESRERERETKARECKIWSNVHTLLIRIFKEAQNGSKSP